MCSTVPFVGISQAAYQNHELTRTELRQLGRKHAQDRLKYLPIGTWVVRHSSFQSLLYQQYSFETSFDESIQAFFAISYCTGTGVKHWLIAKVQDELYYVITERNQAYLYSPQDRPLKFKQLLKRLRLNPLQHQELLKSDSSREYIHL